MDHPDTLSRNEFEARRAQQSAEMTAMGLSLQAGMVDMRTEMTSRFILVETRIDILEQRLDSRIDGVEQRLESKIDGVEQRLSSRIDGVEQRLEGKIDGVERGLEGKIDGLRSTIAVTQWAMGALIACVGLWLTWVNLYPERVRLALGAPASQEQVLVSAGHPAIRLGKPPEN